MFDAREILDEYIRTHALAVSSERHCRYSLSAFERWLERLATIRDLAEHLSDFVRARAETHRPDGVRSQRGVLVSLLKFAAEELGLIQMPRKIRRVKLTDLTPRWFTDDELLRLLKHADDFQRAAILLVRSTTLRRGDVLWRATWDDLDRGGVIRFVLSKSGHRHVVQATADAIEACEKIHDQHDRRLIPWPFGKGRWHKRWKALGARAGVDVHKRGLQAIRRSASSLVAREHGEYAAAKLLGHAPSSGVSVFRRYYAVGELLDTPPPQPPPLTPSV